MVDALGAATQAAMEKFEIHNYLGLVFEAVSEANRHFAAAEPWALKKTDPARMGTVLYCAAEIVRQAAILIQPVVPEGAAKLLDYLGVDPAHRDFSYLGAKHRLAPGTMLPAPSGVFPRLEAMEQASDD